MSGLSTVPPVSPPPFSPYPKPFVSPLPAICHSDRSAEWRNLLFAGSATVISFSQEGSVMLKKIALLKDRVEDWKTYPFSVPTVASLGEIEIRSRVVFFAGENGTGKSTLLEAIAAHYGFGPEGGNRNLHHDTTEHNHSTESLARALRLSFDRRTGAGFFLRAESFFNTASHLDELDRQAFGPSILASYGGQSLHTRSHGETFFTLLEYKFRRDGLFLLDEPEAALSPQRQLAFLVLINDTLRRYKDAQFIISTHSPVLLGYPGAQILSFDSTPIQQIDYEDTAPLQIVRYFLNNREEFLKELFHEEPSLFPD
jgi:predicted ATPase